MNKRDILINTLNNHFNMHDEFMEISQLSDSDIDRIIELYEQESAKDGKEPWNYRYFDDLIIMQKCVYDVIKDNPQYDAITSKLEILYEKELTRRLTKPVYEYGEPTGEIIQLPYTSMEEYSLTLAEMCARNMNYGGKSNEERTKAVETYAQIKNDFNKAGKQMPQEFEREFATANNQELNNNNVNEQSLINNEMDIRNQLEQAKEDLRQKMNWAEQQPNKPQITSLKSDNDTIDYPDDLYIQNPELVDYIHSNFSNLGKVDRILSVSGYPDPQYEVRFENGEVHTFMQPKKTNNPNQNEDAIKNGLVNDVITRGMVNGQIPQDAFLPDIKNVYNNLSVEELQNINQSNTPSVEQIATQMVEDMAKNKIDVNGDPLVQSMENQKVLTKNMENGFAKVWILGILATLVSLGIIIFGILLNV